MHSDPDTSPFNWAPATLKATERLLDARDRDEKALVKQNTNNTPEDLRPKFFYDPTQLLDPEHEPTPLPISYHNGIPELNGLPLWERLPNEHWDYFRAFQHYVNQVRPRRLDLTARAHNAPTHVIDVISRLWLWKDRAELYDAYRQTYEEQSRQKELNFTLSEHTTLARALRQKVTDSLENLDPDTLTPQALTDFLKVATQLERVSLGLPANEPEKKKEEKEGGSIQVSGDKVQINFDSNWQGQ